MSKSAFDPIAQAYDQAFTHTPTGQLQRLRVYEVLSEILQQDNINNVLELSCGTGEDARWLAQQQCRVLATDASIGMVEKAQQKAEAAGLQDQIRCRQLPIENVAALQDEEPFDLVFSNFGGFNCLSLSALQEVASDIAHRIRPGGSLVLVVMPKFCWWESLYFLAKGQWDKAWRRGRPGPIAAPLGDGLSIDTWYHSPKQLRSVFQNHFTVQRNRPIGFFLPPSYLDPFFRNKKRSLDLLNALENQCPDHSMLSAYADHFLLHLVRKKKTR